MKIGILTQPLTNNYGGLIQAFALQKVLKGMGHEPFTIDFSKKENVYRVLRRIIGRIVRKNILRQAPKQLNKKEKAFVSLHTSRFVRENIQTTIPINSVQEIGQLKEYCFNAYVVGSDQVWRPKFSPDMATFFLDFLKDDNKTKRIAYAASFGVEEWEFNQKLTKQCKELAQKFDAISVREDSAVTLCKEYLKVSATKVLDPTLLLNKEDYIELIEKDQVPAKPNTLMVYVLDQTPEKTAIVEKIKDKLSLEINSVMPQESFLENSITNPDNCIYPAITRWLRGFMDAEFVVTDSFHGTVFSIVFDKPFIVIGNKERGLTRFTSLLRVFGIENRMIYSLNELTDNLIKSELDYTSVNQILNIEKKKSGDFLSAILT